MGNRLATQTGTPLSDTVVVVVVSGSPPNASRGMSSTSATLRCPVKQVIAEQSGTMMVEAPDWKNGSRHGAEASPHARPAVVFLDANTLVAFLVGIESVPAK